MCFYFREKSQFFLLLHLLNPIEKPDLHLRPFKLENKQNEKRILYGLFFVVSFLNTISGIFCSAEIFSTYLHQSRADFPVILAAQLLFVFFVRREEFAFLFQTFSRSDPPGKKKKKRKTTLEEKETF